MCKKFISLLLTLSLALSFFAFPAVTLAAEAVSCVQEISAIEFTDDAAEITVKVTNNGSSKADVCSYAAVYNASDILKSTVTCSISVSKNKTQTIVHTIEDYTYTSGDYLKLFLWDENMSPIGNILTEALAPGEQIEGIVIETYLSNSYYVAGDSSVLIVVTKVYDEDSHLEVGDCIDFTSDGIDIRGLLGKSVVANVGENDDGYLKIFSISEKSDSNTVVTLDTDLIENFTATEIEYYKSENAKNTTTAEIQDYVEIKSGNAIGILNVVINGFNNDSYVDGIDIYSVYAALDEITLIDNDNDGDFEFIVASVPTTNAVEFVVDETDDEDFTMTGKNDAEGLTLDYEDEDQIITIIKDGAIVDFSAVVEGDVVTCLDTDVNVKTIYVSSVVVEGTVEEVVDNLYTINGKDYKKSGVLSKPDISLNKLEAGCKGTFYINAFGKIVYADLITAFDFSEYVYIIDTVFENGNFGKDSCFVKAVTSNGDIIIYALSSGDINVYYYWEVHDIDSEEAYDYFLEDYTGLARITLSDSGEISDIFFPDCNDYFVLNDRYEDDGYNFTKQYNEKRGTYGSIDLTPDTLIFHVDTDEFYEGDVEDAVTVTTVADLFIDGNSYSFIAYGEEDEYADVLVVSDARVSFDTEAPVMVISRVDQVVSNGEVTVKLTGVVAGETTNVVLDPDDGYTVDDFEAYNIVIYSESDGYATDVMILMDNTSDGTGELWDCDGIYAFGFSDEYVTTHFGGVTYSSYPKFVLDDYDYFYYTDTTNFTVIDYSFSTPSISVGTKADISTSTLVFAKTGADTLDEVTDVVIFKGLIDEDEETGADSSDPIPANSQFVFITDTTAANALFGETEYYMQAITENGSVEEYKIQNKNVDIYYVDGHESGVLDSDAYELIEGYTGIVKIVVSDSGEISDIILPDYNDSFMCNYYYEYDGYDNMTKYNQERGTYGSVSLTPDTTVFHVDTAEFDMADAVTVTTVADILVDGNFYNMLAYGKEYEYSDVIVVFDASVRVNPEAPVMVVTKVSTVISGNEETIKITGIIAGETVSIIADPDLCLSIYDIEKGNIIIYALSGDYMTDVLVLMDNTTSYIGSLYYYSDIYPDVYSDDTVTTHFGIVTDVTSKKFVLDDYFEFYYGDEVNYITIDYGYSVPQIEVGSQRDIKVSYVNPVFVFAKTAADTEDEVTDVVILKGLDYFY